MAALSFVIPVRHQASVSDWDMAQRHIAATLRSILAQDHDDWACVIVANRGAVLPLIDDPRIRVRRVELPLPALPDRKIAGDEAYFRAVRRDKGQRILAGLLDIRPRGHVMVVDYDDFISRRLAGFVAGNAARNGWLVDVGWLYDEGALICRRRRFHRLCGTSHIVRADLLGIPETAEDATDAWISDMLGSHIFIDGILAERGTPLAPLPFPGAVYRIGHAGTTSQSSQLLRMLYPDRRVFLRHPIRAARRLAGLRLVTNGFRAEFLGVSDGGKTAPSG